MEVNAKPLVEAKNHSKTVLEVQNYLEEVIKNPSIDSAELLAEILFQLTCRQEIVDAILIHQLILDKMPTFELFQPKIEILYQKKYTAWIEEHLIDSSLAAIHAQAPEQLLERLLQLKLKRPLAQAIAKELVECHLIDTDDTHHDYIFIPK
jgi:hypothetical protein